MKAISAVIASILMLMITMALSGGVYYIVNSIVGEKTSITFAIVEKQNTLKIRNDGRTAITTLSVVVDDDMADFVVVPEGTVGYWKMDAVNGSNYTIDVAGGNDGRLYNYPCNPAICNLTDGKYGKALRFDGSDDYVNIPSSASLNTILSGHKLTYEGWVYRISGNGDPFGFSGYNPRWGYSVRITSGVLDFPFQDSGGTWQTTSSTLSVPTNQWTYIAVTYDASAGKLIFYVNGQSEAFDLSATTDNTNSAFRLGKHGWYNFNGTIDEVRIYNRALSADEIKANYDCNSDICIRPGKTGIIKILNPLYKGSHVVEICVSNTCVRDSITVS